MSPGHKAGRVFTGRTRAERCRIAYGGGGGIRTHVTVSRKHAFQACALSHSATPPYRVVRNKPILGANQHQKPCTRLEMRQIRAIPGATARSNRYGEPAI